MVDWKKWSLLALALFLFNAILYFLGSSVDSVYLGEFGDLIIPLIIGSALASIVLNFKLLFGIKKRDLIWKIYLVLILLWILMPFLAGLGGIVNDNFAGFIFLSSYPLLLLGVLGFGIYKIVKKDYIYLPMILFNLIWGAFYLIALMLLALIYSLSSAFG